MTCWPYDRVRWSAIAPARAAVERMRARRVAAEETAT